MSAQKAPLWLQCAVLSAPVCSLLTLRTADCVRRSPLPLGRPLHSEQCTVSREQCSPLTADCVRPRPHSAGSRSHSSSAHLLSGATASSPVPPERHSSLAARRSPLTVRRTPLAARPTRDGAPGLTGRAAWVARPPEPRRAHCAPPNRFKICPALTGLCSAAATNAATTNAGNCVQQAASASHFLARRRPGNLSAQLLASRRWQGANGGPCAL